MMMMWNEEEEEGGGIAFQVVEEEIEAVTSGPAR